MTVTWPFLVPAASWRHWPRQRRRASCRWPRRTPCERLTSGPEAIETRRAVDGLIQRAVAFAPRIRLNLMVSWSCYHIISHVLYHITIHVYIIYMFYVLCEYEVKPLQERLVFITLSPTLRISPPPGPTSPGLQAPATSPAAARSGFRSKDQSRSHPLDSNRSNNHSYPIIQNSIIEYTIYNNYIIQYDII